MQQHKPVSRLAMRVKNGTKRLYAQQRLFGNRAARVAVALVSSASLMAPFMPAVAHADPADPQLNQYEAQFRSSYYTNPAGGSNSISMNFQPTFYESMNGAVDGYFYATQFTFANTGTCAGSPTPNTCFIGYFGFQTALNGGSDKGVIFSLWNTNEATAGTGATAASFGGEGTGMKITKPFDWQVGTAYRMTVRRVNNTSGNGNYSWWEAYIGTPSNELQTYVGKINSNYSNGAANSTNRGGIRADNTSRPGGGVFDVTQFQERYSGKNYTVGGNSAWNTTTQASCGDVTRSEAFIANTELNGWGGVGTGGAPTRITGNTPTSTTTASNYGGLNPCVHLLNSGQSGLGFDFSMGRPRSNIGSPNQYMDGTVAFTADTPGTLTAYPCRERTTSTNKVDISYSAGSNNLSVGNVKSDADGGLCFYPSTHISTPVTFTRLTNNTWINDSATGTSTNQFNYSGWWGTTATTGAYNNDEHFSNTANLYYTMQFTGTQVRVYSMKNPNYGIAAYSVDGGAETNFDHYASARQFNTLAYTSPVLANGTHTVKVRLTDTKNASSSDTYIPADRIVVYAPATSSPATTDVNDTATGTSTNQFNYSGWWGTTATTGAYNNDEHFANGSGSSYTFQFSGTAAKVYSMKNPNYGIAAYSVDGGAETFVDHYAASRQFNFLAYTTPALANGTHTVRVRVTATKNASSSDTYIAADRVQVTTP